LHHWATDDAAVRRALRQPSGEVTLDLRQLNLSLRGVEAMEFLVEFDIGIPKGTSEIEVAEREQAEAVAAAALVAQGHLLLVWRLTAPDGENKVLGLYRADSKAQLDRLLEALPMYDWMHITLTALEPHPNDPGARPVTTSGDGGQR
jgi:muconolactone D-isomerase